MGNEKIPEWVQKLADDYNQKQLDESAMLKNAPISLNMKTPEEKFLGELEFAINKAEQFVKISKEAEDIIGHATYSGALEAFKTCKQKFIETFS